MSHADSSATDGALAAIAAAIADPQHPAKTEVASFAATELAQGDRVGDELASRFAVDDWRRCADRGLLAVMVPTEFGGAGADWATTLLTLEGLGLGCRDEGLAFAIGSQILSTQEVLVRFGTNEQRDRWLGPLIGGEAFGAFCMTEPETGSDAYAHAATALRNDDGTYTLNGHKAYITLGSVADVAVVFAKTNPDAGAWGVSAFLVPLDAPGFERRPNRDKMGMRTTPFCDFVFHDVVLPHTALIGREGSGASIFNSIIEVERAFVFATQVGSMERQLNEAIAYAITREQGGQPIAGYQAVAHQLVDMKRQHETARLFLYRAALAHASGTDFPMAAALGKLVGAETGIAAAMSSVEVHGAKGYVTEFEVERGLRDAVGGLVYSGTSAIQKNIIARLLGL
ncbi:MAG: acyl-CoA/acyl-ACP dehydrogenase [Ilumatobacteraceae bacterium]|nr:acyl-CoA/acyl-ACP dehydrogenase [Ilumatobacteraceae bacterium]